MKTSNIVFASVMAFILLIISVPQLLGLAKIGPDNKPTDFLSRFWVEHSIQDDEDVVLPQFHHIKVDGGGRYFFLGLDKGESDTITVPKYMIKNLKLEVKNDTLFVKSNDREGNALALSINQPLHHVTVVNAQLTANVAPSILAGMNWHVLGQSDLTLSRFERINADTIQQVIPRLDISISEQSKVFLNKYAFQQVHADIEQGLLRYSDNLKVDTMNVKLLGKSTVSSTGYDANHEVKVLNVSGDKDYFRKEFVGKNVQLNVLD